MKGIGDFFKTGEFWTNLEKTLRKYKKRIKQNSIHIRNLERNDLLMLQEIQRLRDSNLDLQKKIDVLEDRLWSSQGVLHTGAKTLEAVAKPKKERRNLESIDNSDERGES